MISENQIDTRVLTTQGLHFCECCERKLAEGEYCEACDAAIRGYERINAGVKFPVQSKLYLVGLAILGCCVWGFLIHWTVKGLLR